MNTESYLDSIRRGLRGAMESDERVYLIGEDLLDPYGGAFKVSKGLSTEFPKRVLTTPISESAITGLATGMAIRGLRPVVEIMFGDFLTLCTDQLVNSATKFPLMYRDKVRVPLVLRTPMGGGRGYGPTHSQSIEKMFLGVPGLTVVSPSLAHDPGTLLKRTILESERPVLWVEYKSLYPKQLLNGGDELRIWQVEGEDGYPLAVVENFSGSDPDVVVIAYGGASVPLFESMRRLIPEEIRVRGLLPSRLDTRTKTPWWFSEITGREPIIVAEHGTRGFTWGSEIAAELNLTFFGRLVAPVRRLADADNVVPAGRGLEREVLLNEEQLIKAIVESIT
ncbi:alpha-ketoacid dehydrogenase subunit beta [Halochromatium salexigens]|uniref:Transketolase-like pyrimidine-binding domain-containing protein n=1 Tax=Halochromatium salexigens TaxID=49447 RepID=A0AAJ0UG30_HALSE|nr:hypothetical protein [Halochromatium salexigens]MBK5929947.1 hypothetical protein [Halochromatium salexigens]